MTRSGDAQGDNRAAEGVQVGDADEARPAGRDHRAARGGLSMVSISPRALAASISEPAAADEASQARARSVDEHRLAPDARRAVGELGGADEQRVRGTQIFRRQHQRDRAQNLRPTQSRWR